MNDLCFNKSSKLLCTQQALCISFLNKCLVTPVRKTIQEISPSFHRIDEDWGLRDKTSCPRVTQLDDIKAGTQPKNSLKLTIGFFPLRKAISKLKWDDRTLIQNSHNELVAKSLHIQRQYMKGSGFVNSKQKFLRLTFFLLFITYEGMVHSLWVYAEGWGSKHSVSKTRVASK